MSGIELAIHLMSKPELTFREMLDYISDEFPAEDNLIISGDPRAGIVHVKLHQEILTNAQQDWLQLTPFSARYIDSYDVSKEEERKDVRADTEGRAHS